MADPGRALRACLAGVIILALASVIGCSSQRRPLPGQQRCVATAGGDSVTISTEQAQYAAVIAGISVRRGLKPRAASIALTTAYQESGIRNLDHGDRDSVGLFQQRPSQGWGSQAELMDPYYATGKFYAALIRIDGWETGDITEIAQRIQISGYPEAYRDHETDGRILASVLTGYSPRGLRCLIRDEQPGRPGRLAKSLQRTYGVDTHRQQRQITIEADTPELAWAYAHYGVARAHGFGVVRARVGNSRLIIGSRLNEWQRTEQGIGRTRVRLTVR
jgi:hypothetical protein